MYYNHKNVAYFCQLRKEMAPWERKLWYLYLKNHPMRFHRQKPIGNYIVDFYCPKASLIIELDGGGHYQPEKQEKDDQRTRDLEVLGLKVIRFCNLDIDRNFRGVCEKIEIETSRRMTLPQSR